MDAQPSVKEASAVKLVYWPSPQDYNEAVQNPAHSFGDFDLRRGQPELTPLGLPRPISGMFASVYRMQAGNKDWAVRCFLNNLPDQQERYDQIDDYLRFVKLPYTVDFDFQAAGIKSHGQWYPILKMEWCEGETLTSYIDRHINEPDTIRTLANSFKIMMLSLRACGIAHGDLQHGNILIEDDQIKLVDYDGMYVPKLKRYTGHELGHRNYQHPGRTTSLFGPNLDNFSAWLIYLSLCSLAIDPSLWKTLRGGDECLILRQSDMLDPVTSFAFRRLEAHPSEQIRANSRILRYLLSLRAEDVPPLDSRIVVPATMPRLSQESRLPDWVRYGGTPPSPAAAGKRTTGEFTRAQASNKAKTRGGKKRKKTTGAQPVQPRTVPGAAYRSVLAHFGPAGLGIAGAHSAHSSRDYVQEFYFGIVMWLLTLIIASLLGATAVTSSSDPATPPPVHAVHEIDLSREDITYDQQGQAIFLNWGNTYYAEGKLEEAEMCFHEVIARLKDFVDSRSRMNVAMAYNNLGNVYQLKGDYPAAKASYDLAADAWKQISSKSPQLATCYANKALAYKAEGQLALAADSFAEALKIIDANGGTMDATTKVWMETYIQILHTLNRTDQAIALQARLKAAARPVVDQSLPAGGGAE